MKQKELELYLHIPFCVQKCRYCDFLSAPGQESVQQHYVRRLEEEIRQKARKFGDYGVTTVFVGGGTPSILKGSLMEEIFQTLREQFMIERGAEITIECNPGTLTEEKVRSYRRAGINRISLGLQSAREEELRRLGRIHTFGQFLENYDLVRNSGFENVNVDLMSALPGQSLSDWETTLRQVLKLHPEHISAYSLMIEEGTPFYEEYGADELRREQGEIPLLLPDEETERAMYRLTVRLLAEQGYQQYEISNYALPGRECRHNTGYWNRKEYLGLGLGSASLVGNRRFSNTGLLSGYMEGEFAPGEVEILGKRQQMEEFMFLGLRLTKGVSRSTFAEQFGAGVENVYPDVLEKLLRQGLLEENGDRILLTEEGISVSNYVMSRFLLEE